MSKQNVVQVERLLLSDALKQENEQHLFVINNTAKTKGVAGQITLNVNSKGRQIGVSIPNTWIPFDLTQFISRADVLAEPHFRRLVSSNNVILVTTKSAQSFMESQGDKAQQELSRLLDVNFIVETSLKKAAINIENNTGVDIIVPGNSAGVQRTVAAAAVDESVVDPFIDALVSRSESGDSAADLISELQTRLSSPGLSSEQIEYILNRVESEEIKEWCVANIENATNI